MTDQTLILNQLLQSILNDIESNMPSALSPKVFFPVKEEPLSNTDANKGNIPPIPEPFNFEQNLIALYDKEFTDPMAYHLLVQQKFPDLANDTNLHMFDSAYCCHCLLSKQEEALSPTFFTSVHALSELPFYMDCLFLYFILNFSKYSLLTIYGLVLAK